MGSRPRHHPALSPEVYGPGSDRRPNPWASMPHSALSGQRIGVAFVIRASTRELQDPVASVTRQYGNCAVS